MKVAHPTILQGCLKVNNASDNSLTGQRPHEQEPQPEKPSITLPGTVEKLIPSVHPSEPDRAQISVEGADHLYREIRVANTFKDGDGNEVALKQGAEVEVTIEADPSETIPKESAPSH